MLRRNSSYALLGLLMCMPAAAGVALQANFAPQPALLAQGGDTSCTQQYDPV